MGRVCHAGGQRRGRHVAGAAHRPQRFGVDRRDLPFLHLHSLLHHCAGRGRPVHAGGPGCSVGPVPDSRFDALVTIEANRYADRWRHRHNSADHYHRGRGLRKHRRCAGKRAGGGLAGLSRSHLWGHHGASAAGDGTVAGLGAAHRHRGRLDSPWAAGPVWDSISASPSGPFCLPFCSFP